MSEERSGWLLEVKEMSGNRRPFHLLSGLIISLVMMMAGGMTAVAGEDKPSRTG